MNSLGSAGSGAIQTGTAPESDRRLYPREAPCGPAFHFTVDIDWIPGSEKGLLLLLDFCRKTSLPATFFVAGRFAKENPSLIREILDQGHEIGAHGWEHGTCTLENFSLASQDVQLRQLSLATDAIASAVGRRPVMFRAPNLWVSETLLEVLIKLEYRLDSSVPAGRLYLGYRRFNRLKYYLAPLSPYYPSSRHLGRRGESPILEVPPSAYCCIPVNMSALRVLGHLPVAWAAMRIFRRGLPLTFYAHPAEFVPAQDQSLPRSDPFWHRRGIGPKNIQVLARFVKFVQSIGFRPAPLRSMLNENRSRYHTR